MSTPISRLASCGLFVSCIALSAVLGGCGSGSGDAAEAGGTGNSGAAGQSQGGSGANMTGGEGGSSSGSGGSVGGTAGTGDSGASSGGASSGGTSGGGLSSGGSGAAGAGGALSCPPTGPYGSTVGDIVPDVPLYDCDGNPVSLHELCDAPVSVVYTFAAWCPVCRAHMESGKPNQLLATYQDQGLEEWVVVTQQNDGSNANAQLCELTRDTYSLTPKVLFDPNDSLRKMVGVQVNSGGLVMSHGGRIELKVGYDFEAVESEVDSLLSQ